MECRSMQVCDINMAADKKHEGENCRGFMQQTCSDLHGIPDKSYQSLFSMTITFTSPVRSLKTAVGNNYHVTIWNT